MKTIKDLENLFNSIPIGIPIILIFNSPYKNIKGIVHDKYHHSKYSYSLFVSNINQKEGGYYWIKPEYSHYFNKRVIGFLNERSMVNLG